MLFWSGCSEVIAQSKALTGLMPARYWIHHGMVTVKGQKMSKSQQNFTSIKNLADLYSPQALRLFLLSKHYRNPLDFTPAKIEQSTAALKKIPRLLVQLEKLAAPLQQEDFTSSSYWQKFCQAMDDDFNTPAAIAVMFQLVRELNKFLEKAGKGSLLPGEKNTLQTGTMELLKMGRDILGVI
ncbi:Putative Cysteinyl-tRNA synthetase, CysS-like [Desulfonema limicola]|uniref:Cysteine--tRNA ligase n=1 Tax=Desulfonema limicola TaxID=45656 RepID=A0A975GGU6_9BACT|nr:DALR domain-containing protein [Desulfonema limicola]QTA80578.1 Putative Cysteinyl-tRNA synthetase, CysS-like [Desulfonema limicola]